MPDGTRLVAMLDNALSTSNAREGDLYTMTARSPSQYEGAVIQGFVSTVNESRPPDIPPRKTVRFFIGPGTPRRQT